MEISATTSVVILLVAILSRIIDKKFISEWKYWIWLLIALRLIIPFNPETETFQQKIEVEIPNITIYVPQNDLNIETQNILPSDGPVYETPETPAFSEKTKIEKSATLLDFLSTAWIAGAAVLFFWNLGVYLVFKNAAFRSSKPANQKTQRLFSETKLSLGIKKNIEIFICENVKSPMVIGFFNPKLILPSEDYPEESLLFILRHELTHYRRKDTFYKAVLLIANAVHWFNPVVWLMRNLAASDLEISCDAKVVKGADMEIRKKYSETILSCVHQEKIVCSVFSTHFYGGAKTLKKRFKNILSTKKRKKGRLAFIIVLVLTLVLGGTVACSTSKSPTDEQIRELLFKANSVYQPGDDSVLEIISYENYIDEIYYDEIGNFEEAVSGIFSEKGIEQILNVKQNPSQKNAFFKEDGKYYRISCMTDSDATNYYNSIDSVELVEENEKSFLYLIGHTSMTRYGETENLKSYATIVYEDGKYLVENFDTKRYLTTFIENGESEIDGLLPGGTNPADYDETEDHGFMYVLTKTEGTRKYKQRDNKGLSYLGEEPNKLIWLLSKNGKLLDEEPFQYCNTFEGDPGEWWVYGIRDGVLYPFYIDENTGEFTEEEPWGPNPVEFFGYTIYEYYWDYHTAYYGVNAPDGSVFAEPIYAYAYVPCENRIALVNGGQVMSEMACTIYDENKNIVNESFNYVFYNSECKDGYVGIAYCGDPNVHTTIVRYDKDGNPMKYGNYFVDGSGNIIDGPFQVLAINNDFSYSEIIRSGEDTILARYFSGEEKEFLAKEILIKD